MLRLPRGQRGDRLPRHEGARGLLRAGHAVLPRREAGRTTESEFREDFRHFLWQFGSIDNYWGHPIYLGGTNRDGTTAYNPLSLVILDVVEKTALPTPKFQLKMAKNTPDEVWWKSLDMLRKHAPLCLL